MCLERMCVDAKLEDRNLHPDEMLEKCEHQLIVDSQASHLSELQVEINLKFSSHLKASFQVGLFASGFSGWTWHWKTT